MPDITGVVNGIEIKSEGELLIDGESMVNRKEPNLAKVCKEKIGFIFQFHYVCSEMSLPFCKNVMLPGLKLDNCINQRPVYHHG